MLFAVSDPAPDPSPTGVGKGYGFLPFKRPSAERGVGSVSFPAAESEVTDPAPGPASPHRRYAPQLLPPRNCLQGWGAARRAFHYS